AGLDGTLLGDSRAISGARVSLMNHLSGLKEIAATMTDAEGHFEFDHLPSGRYTLNIQKRGYFDLIDARFLITGGVKSFYSFRLRECPNGQCRPTPDGSGGRVTVCE